MFKLRFCYHISVISLLIIRTTGFSLSKTNSLRRGTFFHISNDNVASHKENEAHLSRLSLPPWDDTSGFMGAIDFLSKISKGEMKDAILSGTIKHGSIYRTVFLGESYMMVGYDAMQKLVEVEEMGKLRVKYPENMQKLLGSEAIILIDGEKHMRLRKLIFQAFNKKALESYIPSMESISSEFIKKWEELYLDCPVKLHPEIRELIIGMGIKVLIGPDVLTPERFLRMKYLLSAVAEGLSFPLAWDVPFTPFGRAMNCRREMFEMLDSIIAEKRSQQQGKNTQGKDILSILLSAEGEDGSRMSDVAIKDNLVTLSIAAQDTTASAVTSAIMNLAMNKDLASAIANELEEAEKKCSTIGFELFEKCPMLDKFVTETLRMQPPATAAFREVVEDFEFNGYRVPKGANVIFMILGNHYDTRSFTNPEIFDPSRYSRGEGKALAPFGFGFHTCAGLELARLEMKVVLKTLLEALLFNLIPDQILTPDVFKFSVAKSGLLVQFEKQPK